MRILLVDDEQLVLEGLEALLHVAQPDLSLDKSADIETAVALLANIRYELVLLDWNLRGSDGRRFDPILGIAALKSAGLTAPILIVSGDMSQDWRRIVLEHELAGFVPKTAAGKTLVDAVQVALRGGVYMPTRMTTPSGGGTAPASDIGERFPELTDRQRDVLTLLVRGMSNKEIARKLDVSEATVKTHVRAVLQIVGVRRRGEAAFEATRLHAAPRSSS